MPDYNKILLYRITHIENIPHVLRYGITHSSSPNANAGFVPIGDSSLIAMRSKFVLDNGRRLGEYIPFYFGSRMPMLFVIQKGYNLVKPTPPQDIVYCITSVQKIMDGNMEYVFTNGHAVDRLSSQYGMDDIENIDNLLDMKAIRSRYWKDENDLDLKRRKEAEFLVLSDIPETAILGYLVYNEASKKKLLNFGVDEVVIHVRSKCYF
jgi:hypothetical protein